MTRYFTATDVGSRCLARQAEGALRRGIVRGVAPSGAVWFMTREISLDGGVSWQSILNETQHFSVGRLWCEEVNDA